MTKSLLLSNSGFRQLWTASLVADVADSIVQFGLMTLLFSLTGGSTAIANLYVVALLPALVFMLPVGVLLDKLPRQGLVAAGHIGRAMIVILFAIARAPWQTYVLYCLLAAVCQLLEPARNAFLPHLVSERALVSANAFILMTAEIARAIGPASAGHLVVALGSRAVFMVSALALAAAAILVWLIRAAEPPRPERGTGAGSGLGEGLRQLVASGPVRSVTVLNLLAWGMATSVPLVIYTFGRKTLGVGDRGAGWLLSAMGLGMLFGSALLGFFGSRVRRWSLITGGLLLTGVALVLTAVVPVFPLVLAARFGTGLCWALFRSSSVAVLQALAPEATRGRIMAGFNAALVLAMIGSLLVVGRLPDVIGPRATVYVCGWWFCGVGVLAAALANSAGKV